jgi:hypothetical protein
MLSVNIVTVQQSLRNGLVHRPNVNLRLGTCDDDGNTGATDEQQGAHQGLLGIAKE